VACFSKSVVYAATQSVLSTNCSRTAIITGGILFSVLLGGFRRQLDVEASTGRCSFDRCERAQCLRLKSKSGGEARGAVNAPDGSAAKRLPSEEGYPEAADSVSVLQRLQVRSNPRGPKRMTAGGVYIMCVDPGGPVA
jgi:hypothetical protein